MSTILFNFLHILCNYDNMFQRGDKMISFNPLWKQLIDKNMTKTQMREKAGFSMRTLATMR